MDSSKIECAEHFNSLSPPLSPNEYEVKLFEGLTEELTNSRTNNKTVLLLGYTKELIHLASLAIDLNPHKNVTNKCVKGDWFDINSHYNIVIGDGVLNLVGGTLVEHLSNYCDTLIIRFFCEKLEKMKYATYFQHNTFFRLPDKVIETQKHCKILVWNFKNNYLDKQK